ncbi:MAG: hypothetical protein ACPGZU_14590, partial [Ketobacter sp.]
HDFPPRGNADHYFRHWSNSGVFAQITTQLRGDLRESLGRCREASAGIIEHGPLLEKDGLAIAVALLVSLTASILITPYLFIFFTRLLRKQS